jgi:hypothetical protein
MAENSREGDIAGLIFHGRFFEFPPVPKCKGPGAPSAGSEKGNETGPPALLGSCRTGLRRDPYRSLRIIPRCSCGAEIDVNLLGNSISDNDHELPLMPPEPKTLRIAVNFSDAIAPRLQPHYEDAGFIRRGLESLRTLRELNGQISSEVHRGVSANDEHHADDLLLALRVRYLRRLRTAQRCSDEGQRKHSST